MNREGQIISYKDTNHVKGKLIKALDSIEKDAVRPTVVSRSIEWMRSQLHTTDGMELCLKPMVLFNTTFSNPSFRSSRDYSSSFLVNMFGEPRLPGVSVTSIKKKDSKLNTARLQLDFIGHRDSAAKYFTPFFLDLYNTLGGKQYKGYVPTEMKNNFEREYDVDLKTGIPNEITDKRLEYYLVRMVLKVTMKRTSE
jgi:hypothetical protein